MRGWIERRTLPTGEVRWVARWRDAAGRKHAQTCARKTDAAAWLDAHAPASAAPATLTGQTWLTAYLSDLAHRLRLGSLSPSTVAAYRSVLRQHLAPWLAALRLDRLTVEDVQAWTVALSEDVEAGDISPKTYNNVLAVWQALVTYGVTRGWVPASLGDGLHRARVLRRDRAVLDAATRTALLAAATDGRVRLALLLALYAGLRRGELCGLQWGDLLERPAPALRVTRVIVGTTIRPPKTASSARVIDVPGFVVQAWQTQRGPDSPARWVLPSKTDRQTPMHPDVLQQAVAPAFTAVGQPCSLHLCRHTYASLLIAQGESVKYVSAQLGHASIQITLDTYGHLFHDARQAAMDRLAQWAPSGQDG
jgi:integrase